MNSRIGNRDRLALTDWLLLTLVAALPLMNPAIAYPIVLADLIFLALAACLAFEVASGRRRFGWNDAFSILAAYLLALVPSLLATPDLDRSTTKLASEAYLVGLTVSTLLIVQTVTMLRRVVLLWLWVTTALVVLAVSSLLAFWSFPGSSLYAYSRFHFGTLPPGNYPRLALTFFNANMACNYLTVSLGLLFVAWQQAWLTNKRAWLLIAGILVAACATLSPGLGGIALALATGCWLMRGSRTALLFGMLAALVFLIGSAATPIIHSTAPFVVHLPGGLTLAPSGRGLIWTAALSEFLHHPLVGHGIGIDSVSVLYADPSGGLQELTDAHNVILSVAAQAGLAGLAGLAILLGFVVRLTFSARDGGRDPVMLGLGLTFLNAFLYQGLTGSFEDTRHLWVLLGLIIAAARISVTREDGNSRESGAPLPC